MTIRRAEAVSHVSAAAASGDNGAEDGLLGDGGGGVARGARARAAPDERAGAADGGGGRGRRRRVGGGILSKPKGSAVSGSGDGRDVPKEGREAGGEVSRGMENGKKPWVD